MVDTVDSTCVEEDSCFECVEELVVVFRYVVEEVVLLESAQVELRAVELAKIDREKVGTDGGYPKIVVAKIAILKRK